MDIESIAMSGDMKIVVVFAFLNEKLQVLQSDIWVRLSWVDPQLIWNITNFGNISTIHVTPSKIWTPDIVIYNEVGLETGKDSHDFLISVKYDGTVQWSYPRTMETSCKLDVSEFPYDIQKCVFTFGSWAFSANLVDVRNKSGRVDASYFVDNGEWSLVDTDVERHELMYASCEFPFTDVTFTVVLQRRSLYYIYNIIVPCILITVLHLTAFLLPAESGEKISLNVTILLGLTVFLLLVAEIMPPQSLVIPIVGQYFGICVCAVSLSTAMSVFILNLHFRGSRGFPVPHWVRSLILGKLGYVLFYGSLVTKTLKSQGEKISRREKTFKKSFDISTTKVELESKKDNQGPSNENTSNGQATRGLKVNVESETGAILTRFCHDDYELKTEEKLPKEDLGVLHKHMQDKEEDERAIIQDWIHVSLILDRLFFIIFGLIDITAVVFVLFRVPIYQSGK